VLVGALFGWQCEGECRPFDRLAQRVNSSFGHSLIVALQVTETGVAAVRQDIGSLAGTVEIPPGNGRRRAQADQRRVASRTPGEVSGATGGSGRRTSSRGSRDFMLDEASLSHPGDPAVVVGTFRQQRF